MADDERNYDPTPLTIHAHHADGSYILKLEGELDATSAEAFDIALRHAAASSPQRIMIDLDGLTFVDSTGLRTLLLANRRADKESYRLRMTRGTGYVADMFQLTALDRTLPFV